MFSLRCPKYLPAASCCKPADGSHFGGNRRRSLNPRWATWPTCAAVTPSVLYTTPISAAFIYEPVKGSFSGKGGGGCGCHLFNEVEVKDGGSARVQQDEIQEILVLEPQRSGNCFTNLMGSIDSSALHVLPSVR